MDSLRNHRSHCRKGFRKPTIIRTTLYELIETVIDVTGPEKPHLVNKIILEMLKPHRSDLNVSGVRIVDRFQPIPPLANIPSAPTR